MTLEKRQRRAARQEFMRRWLHDNWLVRSKNGLVKDSRAAYYARMAWDRQCAPPQR